MEWVKRSLFTAISLSISMGLANTAQAQVKIDETNFEDMTLEDLLNLSTSVSTRTELPTRSSPGILTVWTEKEIQQSGARDLIDLLHLVPGFSFGTDSFNTSSVGIRGIWANEGKVLVLVDGLEMNEIMFATIQFGNRYPINLIKRVEIIRGPGSAVYGGFAELGVINITTKHGADLKGCDVFGTYSQMEKTFGRRTLQATCGVNVEGTQASVGIYSGQGTRSDRDFTEYTPDPATTPTQTDSFADNKMNPFFINFGLKNEKFNFRYIREDYGLPTTTGFGQLDSPRAVYSSFLGQFLGLDVNFKPVDSWTITPYVQLKEQQPWQSTDVELAKASGGLVSNFIATRLKTGVRGNYALSEKSNVIVGAERITDSARNESLNAAQGNYQATFSDGSREKSYYSDSVYAQGVFNFGYLNLTTGARYEKHSQAGDAFVPRVVVTHAEQDWHVKALASSAFRAPTIMNLDSNSAIKPDRSRSLELEGGHRVSSNSYLTGNLFHVEIQDRIVYGVDPGGATRNFNEDRIATYGIETEYKVKEKWGYIALAYSYYRPDGSSPASSRVPGHDDVLLGFPAHKLTLNSNFDLTSRMKLNTSVVYMSEYFGYNWDDANDVRYIESLKPNPIVNLFLTYERALWENVDLGFGVYNLLNTDYRMAQPYEGGVHAPMPTGSREFLVRADYALTF